MSEPEGLELADYAAWRSVNKGRRFSLFDYLQASLVEGHMPADSIVGLIRLCWPEFISREGLVFLKEGFDEAEYADHVAEAWAPQTIQYWRNLVALNELLRALRGSSAAHVRELGERLRDAWSAKLAQDYPELSFQVELVDEAETQEVSLTFFQPPA